MNRTRALIICIRPQDIPQQAACSFVLPGGPGGRDGGGAGALAKKAHLFLQQARRELPERKPAAEAVCVRVQRKADRR